MKQTLSGHLHLRVARRAEAQGWSVGLVYIGLGTPELAIERVRERVSRGGHNVPVIDVRRRYARSLRNLANIYPLVDRLLVLDNSSIRKRMKRVLEVERGRVVFKPRTLPKWLRSALRAKF